MSEILEALPKGLKDSNMLKIDFGKEKSKNKCMAETQIMGVMLSVAFHPIR